MVKIAELFLNLTLWIGTNLERMIRGLLDRPIPKNSYTVSKRLDRVAQSVFAGRK
jgi:hypothetical protein